MEIDGSSVSSKSKALGTVIGGSFPASLSKPSSSYRAIPANKDFRFFYNFDKFRRPIDEIAANSQTIHDAIGFSPHVWERSVILTGDIDGGDAYDGRVNANEEIHDRFVVPMDECDKNRKNEEEFGVKKKEAINDAAGSARYIGGGSATDVKVADRDKKIPAYGKAKVPFHIPTLKKPQEEYNINVNNANQPFEHVWLERSEDDRRFIHPLEKHSVMDFVDGSIGGMEPAKPLPMEETPFKIVEDVKDLKDLASKLRGVEEFAVDLEHNQYRSFQGLTCLMQISTRTEDYIVDTFKLRVHIGPYLREIFKDPKKKKVLHGADRDIIWLQRDFGIYVCDLFDTGQASRVLKLERNSLEFLLQHYCGVTANKQYQNADWRIRPLPDEMIRYAREDTHYLLYIFDLMRHELLKMPKQDDQSETPLIEVYKRSYDVCIQLYEKELLTENSYLHIYGLQGAGLNAVQLAIVAGLCQWRDIIARSEDESTGYVLPNKTLLDIAREMPFTAAKLRRLLKSTHPYIERNIDSVVSVIRQSMQNASSFVAAAQSLKEGHSGTLSGKNIEPSTEGKDVSQDEKAEGKGLRTVSVNTNEESRVATGLFGSPEVSAVANVSEKSTSGFRDLPGYVASKRKFRTVDKTKEEIKLEQKRSSVSLHSNFTETCMGKSFSVVSSKPEEAPKGPALVSKLHGVIVLEDDADEEPMETDFSSDRVADDVIQVKDDTDEERDTTKEDEDFVQKMAVEDEPNPLSESSSNFQKRYKQRNQGKKTEKSSGFMNLKPGFLN